MGEQIRKFFPRQVFVLQQMLGDGIQEMAPAPEAIRLNKKFQMIRKKRTAMTPPATSSRRGVLLSAARG